MNKILLAASLASLLIVSASVDDTSERHVVSRVISVTANGVTHEYVCSVDLDKIRVMKILSNGVWIDPPTVDFEPPRFKGWSD